MKILITGGSGTLGRALAQKLNKDGNTIVIYSRGEGAQQAMAQEMPAGGEQGLRYFLGDVADLPRLLLAIKGCEVVIHCAAQKMIDSCEYNSVESIKTNILGTENVMLACNEAGVKQAMFISSDKACNPVSMYGAQKFIGERLFISGNNYGKCRFNCVRYGNVIASNKSMFHLWEKQAKEGNPITVTHKDMTRFYWGIDEASDFVIEKLQREDRGCIYVPKMRGSSIYEIAKGYSQNIIITGLRCPEKLHEEMVSNVESQHCHDNGEYYIIYPGFHHWNNNIKTFGVKVEKNFKLTSEVKHDDNKPDDISGNKPDSNMDNA
jgi:UDP-N-acetylglucosamine 4,6-dehydratase/5-epimerase